MSSYGFLVSVGIPVYNEEKNIQRLLGSLARQEKVKIEKTIIVNDGSTDNTIAKINEINEDIKKKLNIELINLDVNEGKSNALNIIFKHAQSDYLVLIDSDVFLFKSDTLKCLLEQFEISSNIGLVCGWYKFDILRKFDIVGRAYKFSSILLEKVALNNLYSFYGATGAIMALPKRIYKSLILPKDLIREDYYIYLYVISLGKKFVFCPKAKVSMPLYEREKIKRFILRQIRVHSISDRHRKMFPNLLREEKLTWFLLKTALHCFVKHPVDGSIWIILKSISHIYAKLSSNKEIPYKWRKI